MKTQSDRELMQQALEALEIANGMLEWRGIYYADIDQAIASLRERLAQPEQEFTTHEEGEDGWSDWVCPDPQSYLMKCCDCGLVHEAQFGVVRYKSEAEREDCEKVDDPNLQAVFRMRRSEEWTPDDTAYRPGGLAQPEQEPVAHLWQHSETGRTRIVLPGQIVTADATWHVVGPLYLTPPRCQWRGLSDDDLEDLLGFHCDIYGEMNEVDAKKFAADIEKRLKEKNA